MTVTALSGAALERANVTNILDLQAVVPGLTISEDTAGDFISVRGVGTGYSGPGLEGSVALYVDDSYEETQTGAMQSLLDIKQVQVLKGPQGTLYGRNATGGAILISTADPVQGETSGKLSASYGNFDSQRYQAVLNLPISSTLAMRVATQYDARNDAYIRNDAFGGGLGNYESYLGRFKLGWDPNTDFHAVAKIEFYHDQEPDNLRQQRLDPPLCLPCALAPGLIKPATGYYSTQQSAAIKPILIQALTGSLKLNYHWNNLAFTSVSAYRAVQESSVADQDAEPPTILDAVVDGAQWARSFTQELRVVSAFTGRLNFTSGAYYENDSNIFPLTLIGSAFDIPGLGQLAPGYTDYDHVKAFSLFSEGYVQLTDPLKLTLGARYSEDHRTHSFINNSDGVLVFGASSGTADAKFVNWTPRAVLAYDTGFGNFYVSYSRGFKSGGFNSPAGTTEPPIKPELITAYEVGAKFRPAGGRMSLDVAAFHYNWSNLQVNFINTATGGVQQENAAAAKNDGFEAAFRALLTRGVTLNLSGVYMHSRYVSFPSAAVYSPAPLFGLQQVGEDVSGFATPRAPRFSGTAGLNYSTLLYQNQLDLAIIESYSTQYDFDPGAGGPLRFDRQSAVALLNLTGTWTFPGNHFSVTAFANNVTDRRYAINRDTTNLGAYEGVAPPCLYGARVTYQF